MKFEPKQHRWSECEFDYDGTPLHVRINESARDWIGDKEYGIKLGFAMPMPVSKDATALDSNQAEALAAIESKIIETVSNGADGIHVMTLTNAVMKELIFYIAPGADIGAMHEALQDSGAHNVQCQAVWDREWDAFTGFLPENNVA